MSDRIQTLSVLSWLEAAPRDAGTNSLHRPDCNARKRGQFDKDCDCGLTERISTLRTALSQPEHQGDEDDSRFRAWLAEEIAAMERMDLTEVGEAQLRSLRKAAREFDRLPTQPPAPVLSDDEREELETIAEGLDVMAHANEIRGKEIAIAGNQRKAAAFLRNLASREHRGEEPQYGDHLEDLIRDEIACGLRNMAEIPDEFGACYELVFYAHDYDLDALAPRFRRLADEIEKPPPRHPAGEVERLREKQLDCGVCGVPETVMVPVGQSGYGVPRCKAHLDQRPYQAEARLHSLLDPPPSDSQGDRERCEGNGWIDTGHEVKKCPGCSDCDPAPAQVEAGGEETQPGRDEGLFGGVPSTREAAPPAAVPSEPSVLEERDGWRKRALAAEEGGRRAESWKLSAQENGQLFERAEAALEDLVAELDAEAEAIVQKAQQVFPAAPVRSRKLEDTAAVIRNDAERVREKAAALKGGER